MRLCGPQALGNRPLKTDGLSHGLRTGLRYEGGPTASSLRSAASGGLHRLPYASGSRLFHRRRCDELVWLLAAAGLEGHSGEHLLLEQVRPANGCSLLPAASCIVWSESRTVQHNSAPAAAD